MLKEKMGDDLMNTLRDCIVLQMEQDKWSFQALWKGILEMETWVIWSQNMYTFYILKLSSEVKSTFSFNLLG